MDRDLHRLRCRGALLALTAASFGFVSVGNAQPAPLDALRTAAETAPAMQGHDAEARMRTPEAEARWRRLFFDPAGREEGVAEVSCDHRVARRPDLDGGPAAVAILWDPTSGRVLLRRWETSESAAVDVEALSRRLAEGAPAEARTDALAFRRCR